MATQPGWSLCSQSSHDERDGMTPVLLPCSRNAHDQNVRVRRPQWDQRGCHSQRGEASKLGGITSGSVRSTSALANQPDRLDQPDRPAQRLARLPVSHISHRGPWPRAVGDPRACPQGRREESCGPSGEKRLPTPLIRYNRQRLHQTLGHVSPGQFEPQNLVPIRGCVRNRG
jgi:hypothetical protein